MSCVFCDIVEHSAPATIIDEDAESICIVPLKPVTDGHLLVIPNKHGQYLWETDVPVGMLRATALLAMATSAGVNVIQSNGSVATQTVPHVHFHIVPRREGDGLPLPWTPQQEAANG